VGVVLGGDHSIALGSVAGAARDRSLGLIWLDAHGDFNTHQTTPSGNIHGMPLAALCGYGDERLVTLGGMLEGGPRISPQNVAIVGVRDLDPAERDLMREAGVTVYSMEAVDRYGIGEVIRRAIDIAVRGTGGIYVSLDLDVVDPMYAPGVGTPVPGGLTYREAHLAAEMLAETGQVVGLDLVEVNPILDRSNASADLAVELALSALGKRVWGQV
jgi:arginase